MGIAFLFGFRDKKALLFLVIVNAVTQIILNVWLNIINFNSGQQAFEAAYIMLELAIFAIEAVLYCKLTTLLTGKKRPVWFYILYAFIANAASFAIGLQIAKWIPGIF
jgi:membrane associated rhomboid family serine protease